MRLVPEVPTGCRTPRLCPQARRSRGRWEVGKDHLYGRTSSGRQEKGWKGGQRGATLGGRPAGRHGLGSLLGDWGLLELATGPERGRWRTAAWGVESEWPGGVRMEMSRPRSRPSHAEPAEGRVGTEGQRWHEVPLRSPAGPRQSMAWQPSPAPLLLLSPCHHPRLRASRCQAAWEAAPAEAWTEAGQGSACGLLSSPTQLWSLSTVQNDLFKTTNNEWLLLNLNVTGYYLVNYDEDNWRRIQTQLQTDLSVGVCPPPPAQAPGPRWCPRLPGPPPPPA